MKVSLDLTKYIAKEYSNLDLIQVPTKKLVQLATERLGGVEGYTDFSDRYDKIVIVKVVSCEPHPNADKLKVCTIDDATITPGVKRDKDGYVQVVCGAPNVRAGMFAVWLPPSASVPSTFDEDEPFVLGSKELRGVVSNGMLASAKELGLSDDHSGLLEVDPAKDEVNPGTPLKDILGIADVVIDIENKMFTHRPDCFGQLGIARELAGIQGLAFNSPAWYLKPKSIPTTDKLSLTVKNEVPELCPRYTAVIIDNVTVGPSPVWLQVALSRVGIRSINNVVDITNYMMALTAQPLHAFDFDKVAKGDNATIIIRKPKKGEKVALLDGKIIEPYPDAVLVCSENGPIGLGGIMGGGTSEVDENTTRVVLECANFDMYNIRRTSMHHGLFTDAVTRFNKGQPVAQLLPVLAKAVEMFHELAGGKVASSVADSNLKTFKSKPVTASPDFINRRLGSDFTLDEIATTLSNVEMKIKVVADAIEVTPPFWRTDIEIAEDLVEEVGRLQGFNTLPIALPKRDLTPVQPDALLTLKQQLRTILCRAGANEVLTYSFVHGNLLERVGQEPKDAYQLRNALSPDLQYYRLSLTPSLLERIHPNVKVGFDQFGLFEIGKIHSKSAGLTKEKVPQEADVLALALTDTSKNNTAAYYLAKRYLDFVAEYLQVSLSYRPAKKDELRSHPYFEAGRTAWVCCKDSGLTLGLIGEYQPRVVQNLKLPTRSAGFEISLEGLLEAVQTSTRSTYQPLSKFPASNQDITLRVSNTVSFADVYNSLATTLQETEFQWQITPTGIYQQAGDTHKNLSFHVELSSNQRTLKTADVTVVVKQLGDRAHRIVKAVVV